MMQFELDLSPFDDPGAWSGKVIQEEPYVKILGKIGWSHKHQSYTAIAQVESTLSVVALKLTGDKHEADAQK